jgi:hypothetical protein
MTRLYLELKRWQRACEAAAPGDAAVIGTVLIASVALACLGA